MHSNRHGCKGNERISIHCTCSMGMHNVTWCRLYNIVIMDERMHIYSYVRQITSACATILIQTWKCYNIQINKVFKHAIFETEEGCSDVKISHFFMPNTNQCRVGMTEALTVWVLINHLPIVST